MRFGFFGMAGLGTAVILCVLLVLSAVRVEVRPLEPRVESSFEDIRAKIEDRVQAQQKGEQSVQSELADLERISEKLPEAEKLKEAVQMARSASPSAEDKKQLEEWLAFVELHSDRSDVQPVQSPMGNPANDRTAEMRHSRQAMVRIRTMRRLRQIQQMFKSDVNKDGILDRSELEKAAAAKWSRVPPADEVLRADRNGDDQLTLEELLEDTADKVESYR